MTKTKLQNHLSNVQYVTSPTKTKDESKVPSVSPRSAQLEVENDNPPSRPESRMGVAAAQSPLGSRPPTNASTSCST